MKQRALIAAALACEPPLLILDEPTTALDVTVEAQILRLLADLRQRRDMSLVFISHNLGVVRSICDDLLVMYASQAVETGPVGDVLSRPRHPYTKGLLASLPPLAAVERSSRLPSIPGRMVNPAAAPIGCYFQDRCSFVESACKEAPQVLEADDDARQVRCWKAAQNGPWPLAKAPASATPRFTPGDALLNLVDLRKRYRTAAGLAALDLEWTRGRPLLRYRPKHLDAVDGISLSISPGEVLGLVGESGCGKSTLGRLALRIVEPR
jgi:peptide/nickel transport system ATP-binding protein